jgi:hypothetical protein
MDEYLLWFLLFSAELASLGIPGFVLGTIAGTVVGWRRGRAKRGAFVGLMGSLAGEALWAAAAVPVAILTGGASSLLAAAVLLGSLWAVQTAAAVFLAIRRSPGRRVDRGQPAGAG